MTAASATNHNDIIIKRLPLHTCVPESDANVQTAAFGKMTSLLLPSPLNDLGETPEASHVRGSKDQHFASIETCPYNS